ncbi:hypothetical protein ACN8ZM_40420 (plasmid) [Burkholderia aenigmatica]|uniref:hypothetical protein n=1 Tax=Burkholderia aenigmatica TaxID=2015348 RepID=UPI003B43989D
MHQFDLVVEKIVRVVRSHQFDLSTEKHLQADIASAFDLNGILYEREKRLSSADILDFLVDEHVAVECKLRGKSRKIDIFRQLERYAEHSTVTAIVLVSNVAMGLPREIQGKPVYTASLSHGWL